MWQKRLDIPAERENLAAEKWKGQTLSLGVVQQYTGDVLRMMTPLTEMAEGHSIRIGALRLDPQTGEELSA